MSRTFRAIDFSFILLEYYKKLKISEEELSIILMIDHLLNTDNNFVTNEMLSLKMNYDISKIDEIFASLLNRGYVEYTTKESGELATSLEPLKGQLYHEFEVSLLAKESINIDLEYQKKVSNLYGEFEKNFERTLAPVEIARIDEWLHNGYSVEKVIYALKTAVLENKKNIKAIDGILLKNKISDDVVSEGYSIRNSKNTLDAEIQEKIDILKTPRDDKNWKKFINI